MVEDEEEYIPKKQTVKKVAKATPSLRSQGQTVEVVRNTGLKSSLKTTMEKRREMAKTPGVKINTDRGFVPDSQIMRGLGRTGTTFAKSTAKDEKTRLYETNDSLLNPQEIMRKYSYVAQDKDMDYATLRRAVNKGMSEVGRTLRGTNDNSQYEKVAKLQAELQGRLKSASFTAGLLEGTSGGTQDVYNLVLGQAAKKSRNEKLTSQAKRMQAQLEETKAQNPGWGTVGQLTGEFGKAGAGYMTIGKVAEKGVQKGAEKLGKKMATATAPDAMQKLAAGVLFDPKKAKTAQFVTRMLGQQAADTAVNTPITIVAGMAEGKSRKEILQDFGKQEAMDAAFNVGLAGLGAAGKVIGDAAGTRIAMHRIPKQIEKRMTGQMKPNEYIKLGKTPEILQKHGMIDGEMLMPQGVVPKVAYPAGYRQALAKGMEMSEKSIKKIQGHNLGFEVIRQLPDKMKRPVAILKSDTQDGSIVVLTDMVDRYGQPVIVPIKVDQNGTTSFGNIIPSMYGRKDFLSFMATQKEKGNILYLDKKKDLQKLPNSGVQFPESFNADADPMLRIAQRSGNVKEAELQNVTKGNKLEQAEREFAKSKTKEVAKSFDANSPQVTSKNVSRQPSDNSIAQNSENVKERDLMQDENAIDYGTLTTADVKGLYDEQYRAQKAAEKMRRKMNLSEGDKLALQKLLRGEIDEATVRSVPGINGDDIMELYAVEKPLYDARKSVQNYKKYANEKKYKEVAEVVGDIPIRSGSKGGWRDLAPLRMARETQERILDMVAPTKEKAKQLKETLFDPIHTNERDRTLFKNEFIDRLKNTKISTKKDIPVKMPNGQTVKTSESALVQWLGENRYQLRQMEKKKGWATAEDIAKEQDLRRQIEHIEGSLGKDQLAKIDGAIVEMTDIYKEIHPKINEVLIRNGYDPVGYIEGYFPHMNFDDPNNIIEAAAQKLGFDFASKELPMDIAGRTETFRPGKKWAGNLLSRTGKETDYDALRAFDLYIDNISDVIYHTDDIKRLRAYEDYMRYTLSDDGIKERVDAIRNNGDLSEIEKAKQIDEIYEGVQNHSLQNYVSNIRLYTDLLAGKKHKVDRVLETEMFGRKVYKVVNEMENRVAGNMVAANIGSALTNFIPITQGMSSMSLPSNLRGLGEALVCMSKGEMDELTKKSAFLATREGSDLLYKTGMRKFSDAVSKPMEWADKFSTQAVWRSRYYDNIAKGMAEEAAIKNADEFARGLFAGRSKGAMPTAFSAKALKPLTMFQLEVNNQISYLLKDIPKEAQGSVLKMMKAYGGIIIGAYIYNDVYEKLTGRRSALDPFGIANETFGDLTGRQMRNTLDILGDAAQGDGFQMTEKVEKKKPSQAITALSEEIGGNVPFVGGLLFDGGRIPLQSAIPSVSKIAGAAADMKSGDATAQKGMQTVRKELEKPLWYLGMPVGGGQMRKTLQGLDTMRKGGSYNQTNEGTELQFPVDQESKRQWVQAGLFGKWATPGGKAYMEKNQSLGAKQTETYEKLVASGAKNMLAFETINKVRKEEKAKEQRRVIRSGLLSGEQKAILYYDLVASERDKEVLDYFNGKDSIAEAADCLSRIADYKGTLPKRNVLQNANLSDAEKEYICLNKIVQEDDIEKEKARIAALRQASVGMNDYLKIKNKYGQLYDSEGKAEQKAAWMSQWMQEQGYTWQQRTVIGEVFPFWSQRKKEYR